MNPVFRVTHGLIFSNDVKKAMGGMMDVMQAWLASGEHALLENIFLSPRCAGRSSTAPLVIKSEEGLAYFLIDEGKRGWILKKFVSGQQPQRPYVDGIQHLVPSMPGFESAFQRKVLTGSSVSPAAYCNNKLQAWIDGTILMPEVVAPTWLKVADSIREGPAVLSTVERLRLVWELSEMVACLESRGVAHRDLSSNKLLIDLSNSRLHFVDWDNLYHPTLTLQRHATFGTNGYTAPFVNVNSVQDLELTWQQKSDRFALAVLNSEFLAISAGSSRNEEGGLLEQDDVDNRSGRTLFEVRDTLSYTFPDAVELLDSALNACSFAECPSPADWIKLSKH